MEGQSLSHWTTREDPPHYIFTDSLTDSLLLSDSPPSLFFFFWLVFVAASRLSLVAMSTVDSLAAVHRLLIAVASFVAKHRLQGAQVQWLQGAD